MTSMITLKDGSTVSEKSFWNITQTIKFLLKKNPCPIKELALKCNNFGERFFQCTTHNTVPTLKMFALMTNRGEVYDEVFKIILNCVIITGHGLSLTFTFTDPRMASKTFSRLELKKQER